MSTSDNMRNNYTVQALKDLKKKIKQLESIVQALGSAQLTDAQINKIAETLNLNSKYVKVSGNEGEPWGELENRDLANSGLVYDESKSARSKIGDYVLVGEGDNLITPIEDSQNSQKTSSTSLQGSSENFGSK